MKLTAFNYGVTEITGKMAFPDGDENIKLPIGLLFFLIEDKDKKILVDTGCDTMPGFKLYEFESPVKVLESYGVDRGDITDVIVTHSHHDHIDALRHYPQAVVHIHRDAFETAGRYLTGSDKVSVFDNSLILADGIEIRYIGGHSKGSSIVLISGIEKTFVLCGDECYTKENLTECIPTGSSACPPKSKLFVEEYRKGKYETVLFHDIDIVKGIGYKVLFES